MESIVNAHKKPKRNEPCPCGSGKKYKKCCGTLSEDDVAKMGHVPFLCIRCGTRAAFDKNHPYSLETKRIKKIPPGTPIKVTVARCPNCI